VHIFVAAALLAAAAAAGAGCGGGPARSVLDRDRLLERRQQIDADVMRDHALAMERLAARVRSEQIAEAAGGPPARLDVLILSGGGDYGAFGAGFLAGWGDIADGPMRRPDFDVVNGVSTGALIAPFAFIGTEMSYARIMKLYSQPSKDWLRLRGLLFFLPSHESFYDTTALANDVAAQVDDGVIAAMARGHAEGRILGIGATNLDFGRLQPWNLADVASTVVNDGVDRSRVHKILMASSAIPGAFPPVEIDGLLFADGGITSNILYSTDPASDGGLLAAWERLYPDAPSPRFRYWVIINNQLAASPQTVQPRWLGVSERSLSAAIRAATTLAVRHLAAEVALLGALGYDAELMLTAIPDDWTAPKPGTFERETMQSLIDLGRKMGSDPASWRRGIPGPAGEFRMPNPANQRSGPAAPPDPSAPPTPPQPAAPPEPTP
jgi:predicted acylesterase/phospholipase RssA